MQGENCNDLLAFLAVARERSFTSKRWPTVPELDWKSYRETKPDNAVSGSTTNGGSVLLGKMTDRMTLKSWTIIRGSKMKKNGMRPVPPGEILNEEFLKPLGLTANALALCRNDRNTARRVDGDASRDLTRRRLLKSHNEYSRTVDH